MKYPTLIQFSAPFLRRFMLPAVLVLAGHGVAAQDVYTAFVGRDVNVIRDHELFPVLDYGSRNVTVAKDGETERMFLAGVKAFALTKSAKITSLRVDITDLEMRAAFARPDNPLQLYMGKRPDVSQFTTYEYYNAQEAGIGNEQEARIFNDPVGTGAEGFETGAEAGERVADKTKKNASSAAATARMDSSTHDAVYIQFRISAEQPIDDVYVVTTALIRPSPSSEPMRWVWMESIGDVGPKVRKVSLTQEGLFGVSEIIEPMIYVYSGQQEIASNLSEERQDMTRDAAAYLINAQYLKRNEGATIPAKPIMQLIPKSAMETLAAAGNPALVVTVNDEGLVSEVGRYGEKLSDDLVQVAGQLVFHPALKNGKPVESKLNLQLKVPELAQN